MTLNKIASPLLGIVLAGCMLLMLVHPASSWMRRCAGSPSGGMCCFPRCSHSSSSLKLCWASASSISSALCLIR